MRKLFILMVMMLVISSNICMAGEKRKQGDKQLFLAHNIWKMRNSYNQKCINYKVGQVIPFGSEVVNAEVFSKEFGGWLMIGFTLKETKKRMEVRFTRQWHPGKTIYDYYDLMFTEKNPFEISAGMDAEILKYASQGELITGMSKQEVILVYGYPPEHVTPSLDKNVWTYWMDKFRRKKICFDEQDKTVQCTALKTL